MKALDIERHKTHLINILTDIFRKDEPDEKRTLIPEEALKNTKSKENNLFKVKAVLTE